MVIYESGMPVDGSNSFTTTQWGKIPNQATTTYAFATSSGSRALQDVGYNGLTDKEEQSFSSYQSFLNGVRSIVTPEVYDSIQNDPANDNYHYFRGSDFDRIQAPILYQTTHKETLLTLIHAMKAMILHTKRLQMLRISIKTTP